MKLDEMTMILGKAKLTFPNVALSAETIKAWFDLFQDETREIFYTAMRAAVKEPGRAFFPAPGEVQAHINRLKNGAIPAADEVWCALLGCASGGNVEGAARVVADNPAGQKALRRVSFDRLRYADIETELPWIRKEFIQAYDEHVEKAEKDRHIEIAHDEAKRIMSRPAAPIGEQKKLGAA